MTGTRESAKAGSVGRVPAPVDPVARLMVDVALPHLDRPFDYLVSAELSDDVSAGSRVRVRFSGRLVDAYVLNRGTETDHQGQLAFIDRSVGSQAVLTADTIRLFRSVADRWAGNFVDVVRLGVPPRHARAETIAITLPPSPLPDTSAFMRGWARYGNAAEFESALSEDRAPRAVWAALPGEDWPRRFAELAHSCLLTGRGTILVVPDARDLARLDVAMTTVLGAGYHVALSADLGPAERYRRWLSVRRGAVKVVIGTRAAAYAPVADLGLLGIWDDGDSVHCELRAPYPHIRDVLVLRSGQSQAALVIGGFTRTTEAAYLVQTHWAQDIVADRAVVRSASPRIAAAGDDFESMRDVGASTARMPSLAIRVARRALSAGQPILVQVPRRGYVPSLACVRDRTPARCTHCAGPLAMTASTATAACRWCGRPALNWACPRCGGAKMRAVITGAGRTAEELGRMFSGVTVRMSSADTVLSDVAARPEIVIATPGAEPVADGGYGAALLLDGWALLSRPELNAGEETLRRWANAAALVRSDGDVVVMAESSLPVVQALIRWDPAGFADRELTDRRELRFPPYSRIAKLTGPPTAVQDLLAQVAMPVQSEIIGTITLDAPPDDRPPSPIQRTMIRSARMSGAELAHALKVAAVGRSARKAIDPVKIELDPNELF